MLAQSGQRVTTNRTSIRRRLTVGRTAHAPPWGRRKAGHRSIVPPLAATIAATLAVRAGMALARAARETRARNRRDRCRRIGLAPGEALGPALHRMALGQLDITIERIGRIGEVESPERAVHEARKALKRLRALLRLLEPELGEAARTRENEVLRTAANTLSGARDADVLLSTLDGLVGAHASELAGRSGVMRMRAHLRGERDRAWRAVLGDADGRAMTLAELRGARARVAAWQLPADGGVELVRPGLLRLYRQGRARLELAARARGARTRALHRWRKRVKDLRYATEMLAWQEDERSTQSLGKRARRRRAQARKQAAWLRRVARRADELGEVLGEEHDLAVLGEYVAALGPREPGAAVRVGRRTRRKLLKLIAARRRVLRKRALRQGERLYRRRPRRFAERAVVAHKRARPGVS
jgi:CHAD domain-containing protein